MLRALPLALVALAATSAAAQQLEAEPRPAGQTRPPAYLPADAVDQRWLFPPPPAVDSPEDRADLATVEALQSVDDARYREADQDARFILPRFEEAFGGPIRRGTQPRLVTLIDRALRDVAGPTFVAKERFGRPRPYQRIALRRVCGEETPPKPEAEPKPGTSYPSGHSAYGWTTAMILAQVRPDHAEALLSRAETYAESRLVCGVHFPSDVAAGRAVAAAILGRLAADPGFQADLAAARAEAAQKTSPAP